MMRVACSAGIAFCAFAGALTVALTAPTAPRPTGSATPDASDLAIRPHAGARLPLTARFIDEHGRPVVLGGYFTKLPVILVLEYLRCTSLCSVTLTNVMEALNRLPLDAGRDYALVAISIDPRDKPADALVAQAKYAGLLDHGDAGTGVHFLTTAFPSDVRAIADTIGFPYRYDTLLDAYIHPAGFVTAARNGVICRYVEGVATSPQDLMDAIADAEQGRPQDPLTRLLLFCHIQGAPLGRFTAAVLTAFTLVEIAAGLTLIAIFAAVWRRRA